MSGFAHAPAKTLVLAGALSAAVLTLGRVPPAAISEASAEPPPPRPVAPAPGPGDRRTELVRLAGRYCFSCHGPGRAEADLDLDAVLTDPGALAARPEVLSDILRVVADGSMPPKSARRRLDDARRAALAAAARTRLAEFEHAQKDDPGPVVIPRLTREEYRNVIRDLSGGVVADAGRLLPNEGGAGEGFSNVGAAQGMTAAQFEKYVEAAKSALRHLRAYPSGGLVWRPLPREPVDDPAAARQEAVDDVIAWYVAAQEQWGPRHRDRLREALGFAHAAYMEAAWRYHHRRERGRPDATFADIAAGYEVRLSAVALEKWHALLTAAEPPAPFREWAAAWKALPPPAKADDKAIRAACAAIELGKPSVGPGELNYGPDYERSWANPKRRQAVLDSARTGVWPFDIEIGDAKELFLVMTEAGEKGNRAVGEWRAGRVVFSDGSARPWREVVKVVGANSGKPFVWGRGADGKEIAPDAVGVQPPGAVKFAVPAGAVRFEVEAAVDAAQPKAAVQALVLREKPKAGETSFYPGRVIFGPSGIVTRKRTGKPVKTDLDKLLERRNLPLANVTKAGLNAERNALSDWTLTDVSYIGGPWPTHREDAADPNAPYHLTAAEARRNAIPAEAARLRELHERLASVVQAPQQDLGALLKARGRDDLREGVVPPASVAEGWPAEERARVAELSAATGSRAGGPRCPSPTWPARPRSCRRTFASTCG